MLTTPTPLPEALAALILPLFTGFPLGERTNELVERLAFMTAAVWNAYILGDVFGPLLVAAAKAEEARRGRDPTSLGMVYEIVLEWRRTLYAHDLRPVASVRAVVVDGGEALELEVVPVAEGKT